MSDTILSTIYRHTGSSIFKEILKSLATISNVAEELTYANSKVVATISLQIGQKLGYKNKDLRDLFYAALLHDIGEIYVDHWLLTNATDPEIVERERTKQREHTIYSSNIMAKIPTLQEASRYVLFHHEAFNGKGYPYGLDGDKIPTQSQIIGIADLLYTNYLLLHNDIGSAVSAVKILRGTRFNPIVVDALASIYEHDKFWFITGISDLELDIIQNFDLAILIEYSHIRESGYFDELLDVYLSIIDIKHKYTRQHSHRVAQISKLIAQQAGLPVAEVNDIYYAGLLHDIGKVAIPQYILNKPSELSVDEYEMIKSHPEYTYAILSKVNIFENIAKLARYHHEKHSGGGYPHNLKGDEIPVGSRIISIADAYDAITSNRPYTGQYNSDFAIQQLVRNPYKMFDPDLLAAVVKIPVENLEQFTVNKR